MKNAPACSKCGASGNGAVFPLLPKTKGYRFGEICVECDETLKKVKSA